MVDIVMILIMEVRKQRMVHLQHLQKHMEKLL